MSTLYFFPSLCKALTHRKQVIWKEDNFFGKQHFFPPPLREKSDKNL
jgi:hypothetical protein